MIIELIQVMNTSLSSTMNSVPISERPRERCLETGSSSLSLRECLALILGSGPRGVGCLGLADLILNRPGVGLLEPEQEIAFFTALESEDLSYLKSIPGLGPAGQARLLATFELGKRYMQYRSCQYHSENRGLGPDYKQQNIPDLAYSALAQVPGRYRIEPKEWFGFVPFYKNQTLGGLSCVERGTRTHVNIDPVELFARLLVLRPKGFFLFHNHPSGDPEPSLEDQILTQTVDHLSHQFGVQLLGHWIVTIETDRFIRV